MAMPRVLVPVDKVIQVMPRRGFHSNVLATCVICVICDAEGEVNNESRHGYKFNAVGLLDGQLVHKVSCAMNQHAASRLS